jgi:hypothetical protein
MFCFRLGFHGWTDSLPRRPRPEALLAAIDCAGDGTCPEQDELAEEIGRRGLDLNAIHPKSRRM